MPKPRKPDRIPGPTDKPGKRVSAPIDFDDHLPSRLIVLANGLALHAYRLYSSTLGLRGGDWRIISALGYHAPISYNNLALRIGMDRAGISRTIASLLRRGLIERHKDAADRRQSILLLTRKGVAVHDKIAPIARAREQRLVSVLSEEELRCLDTALRRLQDEVDVMIRETSP
jgi:DNA-binding MarR family transcriptional regulator